MQDLVTQSGRHNTSLLAAALAFYALFSLFPLLLLVVSAAGYLLPSWNAEAAVLSIVREYLPAAEELVQKNLQQLVSTRAASGITGVVGVLWVASNVFSVLTVTLNQIWEAPLRPQYWLQKVLGMAMVIVAGLIVLGSLTVAALVAALAKTLAAQPAWSWLAELLNLLSSVAFPLATLLLIALSYRFLPGTRPPWGPILLSSFFVTALLQAVRFGFAWYVSSFGRYQLLYGALASVIIFAFWMYLASVIFLYGAELAALLSGWPQPRRPKA
ncbi:MAG: YihY/virulence factor BrkB family protein [Bacillota bacterium]|nr:YihY/virulence factor BrkB family protein [Bacillota bacterium]